jgi:protein involved in polysaccharide export with SLBB domain
MGRQSPGILRLVVGLATLLCAATGAIAQTPQIEYLRRNPELIRQQLLQSNLTPDQIRQRLTAAGVEPGALDQFLGPIPVQPGAGVADEQFRALRALGIYEIRMQGLEPISLDTGLVPSRAPLPTLAGDSSLQIFGLSVFRGRSTLFQPTLSGPVPPDYKVGPGDLLTLVITGDIEFVYELAVSREGGIVIPQVGQVFVNGLSMEQLRQVLRRRLGASHQGIRAGTAQFDVTISRLRANQVYVVGEVAQPGAYVLASVATVLNAVYAAGGPTEQANLRSVTVRRQGQVTATLDLYDYLLRGDTRNDVVLQQGDVVFVPVHGTRASISGAVTRPGIYELKPDESLEDLIRAAGGFRPDADLRRIAVQRLLPPDERQPGALPRAVLDVTLGVRAQGVPGPEDEAQAALRDVIVPLLALVDGDSVVVDAVTSPGASLTVSIAGMVRKAGTYPWREGITLREVVGLARGPLVGADLREAEIARLPADRASGQLGVVVRVPLDSSYLFERDSLGAYLGPIGLAFPPAGSAAEVALQPFDLITIFRQPEFELQRTVQVTGEVRFPGMYALTRRDERLSDLVGRSGGLLPTAYPLGAQLFRQLHEAGRVNVELPRALNQPAEDHDLMLEPGDSLHVPRYNPTVRVEGAVNSPTSVLYREGAGLGYYIANAGGYAPGADKGKVSVRYANGTADVAGGFLFFRSSPTPGPGSSVYVPMGRGGPVDVRGLITDIVGILGSLTTIIVVLTQTR